MHRAGTSIVAYDLLGAGERSRRFVRIASKCSVAYANAGCLLALQGINAPLVAHKDGRGSTATIQIATPLMPEEPKKKKAKMGNPTRVLLLRNMVGRGDVDDDLQECGSSALPCRALICHHLCAMGR